MSLYHVCFNCSKSSDRAFAKKCVCGMDQYDHDESDIALMQIQILTNYFFIEPASERMLKYNSSILEILADLCLVPPSFDEMLQLYPTQEDAY